MNKTLASVLIHQEVKDNPPFYLKELTDLLFGVAKAFESVTEKNNANKRTELYWAFCEIKKRREAREQ